MTNNLCQVIVLGVLAAAAAGCSDSMAGDSPPPGMSPNAGGNYDYGASDADVDADADADGSEDPSVPDETEQTATYAVPMGAGRYVFVPDEARDTVVVVDSETLQIRIIEVGSRPTHMVTLEAGDVPTVAVINLNSDDVTIIEMDGDGGFATRDIDVRPDTNALAPSPDGRFIVAYHDPNLTAVSGAPATDQEISIIDVEGGESVERSVGMHPWKVLYNDDVTRAFVVTEGGINVIDLENLEAGRVEPVTLFESGSYTAETADIEITADGTMAIGRKSGTAELKIARLDGSETAMTFTLPAVPTDLDVSADGTFGLMVLRELSQVAFFDLPLDADAVDPFTYVDLPGKVVGLATLSENGDHVLLFTSVAGTADDLRRITLMNRTGDTWAVNSALLERPIEAVVSVDGTDGETETAVVIHQSISTGISDKPFAYTLVTIPTLMTKLQMLATQPGQLLLTPDGDYGFLLLRNENKAEKIDLGSLIVNDVMLSSPPTAAGYAGVTDTVFIAQDHPAGRMTFIGVTDESTKTITGFNLNEEIEISE